MFWKVPGSWDGAETQVPPGHTHSKNNIHTVIDTKDVQSEVKTCLSLNNLINHSIYRIKIYIVSSF